MIYAKDVRINEESSGSRKVPAAPNPAFAEGAGKMLKVRVEEAGAGKRGTPCLTDGKY
jgi:hypothetical protein